jgi:hypothetical protein
MTQKEKLILLRWLAALAVITLHVHASCSFELDVTAKAQLDRALSPYLPHFYALSLPLPLLQLRFQPVGVTKRSHSGDREPDQ